MILLGFSSGYLLVVSTHAKDMGQELHLGKFHPNLSSFAYNPQLKRVASVGDDGVRIIDLRDFKESKADYILPEVSTLMT
jgi:WD repeat-containing protein 19